MPTPIYLHRSQDEQRLTFQKGENTIRFTAAAATRFRGPLNVNEDEYVAIKFQLQLLNESENEKYSTQFGWITHCISILQNAICSGKWMSTAEKLQHLANSLIIIAPTQTRGGVTTAVMVPTNNDELQSRSWFSSFFCFC